MRNRQAGFLITQHLLQHGAQRVAFVAKPHSAATVVARIAGYREALYSHGISLSEDLVRRGEPEDPAFIDQVLTDCNPDGIVCANDFIAARVMTALAGQGVRVPADVRIVGIDDVKYAALLPVPLTTQHQNCADIGAMAMVTMLQLQTNTMIRKSCGTKPFSPKQTDLVGRRITDDMPQTPCILLIMFRR